MMIPYGRQDVRDEDIESVVSALRSDFLTQGPAVPRFEEAVAGRVGAKHAVAVNSGTSALHLACMALGLGPGDLLWTVPNTFVASANCARYCGADVDFVDIDRDTWNISVDALEEKLEHAESSGRLPRVVVPVHFSGQPTWQREIRGLGERYGFRIIEDACHSLGASRDGEPVGSCRWSDVTVFSFHPVKIITSAEGGMAMCNDPELAQKMSLLRSHGITRDGDLMSKSDPEPWYYEQLTLGYNYRMTDLQAALGLSQLGRLDHYVRERNRLADRYGNSLRDLPLTLPLVEKGNVSSYHLYVIRLPSEDARRRVRDALFERGVGSNLHYLPVHLQPYYRSLGFQERHCPEAERYSREALTIPLYPAMGDAKQDMVISALEAGLSGL